MTLDILSWHVHGSYMRYLAHAPHRFWLPVKDGRPEGYGGRPDNCDWGLNIQSIPAEAVADRRFDLILYQSHRNWLIDRDEILSPAQRRLPQVYLEHDPPRESPTDTRHPVDDDAVTIAHCTHFNALMWDSGDSPVRVIEHGVEDHGPLYTGELDRGLAIVNGLPSRGRRLGLDVFERARAALPIDLLGMQSERIGGLGEIPLVELPAFAARYRFVFHPIRYTSLGLALLEAMMLGLPVVGLATTELPTIIENGRNGFIAADERALHEAMQRLLADRELARRIGMAGRETALARFNIARFASDWDALLRQVAAKPERKAA